MSLDVRLGRRPTKAKNVLRDESKVLELTLGRLLLSVVILRRRVRIAKRGEQSVRTKFNDKGGAVREVDTESLLVGSEEVGHLSSAKVPGEKIVTRTLRWHDDSVMEVFGCRP